MKKLTLILVVIYTSAFGQGMKLNEDLSWSQILKKAETEGKPIFVDAYTTWCGPCKWMAKNVFPTDSAGSFYNANFVSYKLDMEKGEGIDFAKKYNVSFFPTYLFFDKNGTLVHRSGGRKPLADFIQDGRNALDPDKQLLTLAAKFKANPTDKKTVTNYALAMLDAGESSAELAEAYYKVSDPAERLSKEAFYVFSEQSEFGSASFNFMKANAKNFKDVDEGQVKEAVFNKYEEKAERFGKKKELQSFISMQPSAEADLGKTGWKHLVLSYYSASKDHAGKIKAAEELFSDPEFKDPYLLNSIAWYVFESDQSTEADVLKAIKWSEKSLTPERRWAYLDTYASLLYKAKKYDDAEKYAKEAIAAAEKQKEDAKGTVELLEKIRKERK